MIVLCAERTACRPVARLLAHGGHHDFLRGHLIIFLPIRKFSHFISSPHSPDPSHKQTVQIMRTELLTLSTRNFSILHTYVNY